MPLSSDYVIVYNKLREIKCYCLHISDQSIQEDNAPCAIHALKYFLPLEILPIISIFTSQRHNVIYNK